MDYVTNIIVLTLTLTVNLFCLYAITKKWFGVMKLFLVLTLLNIYFTIIGLAMQAVVHAANWIFWLKFLLLEVPMLFFKIQYAHMINSYR